MAETHSGQKEVAALGRTLRLVSMTLIHAITMRIWALELTKKLLLQYFITDSHYTTQIELSPVLKLYTFGKNCAASGKAATPSPFPYTVQPRWLFTAPPTQP